MMTSILCNFVQVAKGIFVLCCELAVQNFDFT
jgi:hypothetical protein